MAYTKSPISSMSIPPIFLPTVLTPDTTGWQQAGNAGNTGGPSSAVPHGTYVLGQDENGNLRVSLYPVTSVTGVPWDTYYFYNDVGYMEGVRWLSQTIAFQFPSTQDLAACAAWEWEMEYCVDGDAWNCGWQALPAPDASSVQVRVFDNVAQVWKPCPGDPVLPYPTVRSDGSTDFMRFVTEHEITASAERHAALWVNDKRYPVEYSQSVLRGKWPKGTNYLHVGFQFDSKGQGVPFHAIVAGASVARK